jgi:hypothetical protein
MDAGVDVNPQGGDGPLGIPATGQLRQGANNAFAVGTRAISIFIPGNAQTCSPFLRLIFKRLPF